ncbi:hypothetical protein ACOMHN_047106 [Nucella lapillus]
MDDERLIAAVRMRGFIYNKDDKNHSNRDMLLAAWNNIAREMGNNVTSAECKTRWASIRDHFRSKHKEMTTTKSGQAATKKRKWHLYDFLTFLIPSCSTGATSGNLPQIIDEHENTSASSDDETSRTSTPTTLQSDQGIAAALPKPRPAVPQKTARSSSSKKDQLSIVDKEVLQALKEPEKDMDENEHFFRSLLPSMKILDAVETLELRSEIQHLVLRHVKAKVNKVSPPNFRADAATALPAANRAISTSPQPCPSASTYNVTEDYNQGTYRRQQPYQEYTQDEYSTGHQYQRLAFE